MRFNCSDILSLRFCLLFQLPPPSFHKGIGEAATVKFELVVCPGGTRRASSQWLAEPCSNDSQEINPPKIFWWYGLWTSTLSSPQPSSDRWIQPETSFFLIAQHYGPLPWHSSTTPYFSQPPAWISCPHRLQGTFISEIRKSAEPAGLKCLRAGLKAVRDGGWHYLLVAHRHRDHRRYLHLTHSLKCTDATKHLLSTAEDLFT